MVSQVLPDWIATRHAILRMIEREVAVEAIDAVLLNYDIKRPTPPVGHHVRTDILIGEAWSTAEGVRSTQRESTDDQDGRVGTVERG